MLFLGDRGVQRSVDHETVYEFEGVAGGVEYEIEVTADGRVLEVESDN